LRARRILSCTARVRSQAVALARRSSSLRSSARRLAAMVDAASVVMALARAKAEPSHSLSPSATAASSPSSDVVGQVRQAGLVGLAVPLLGRVAVRQPGLSQVSGVDGLVGTPTEFAASRSEAAA